MKLFFQDVMESLAESNTSLALPYLTSLEISFVDAKPADVVDFTITIKNIFLVYVDFYNGDMSVLHQPVGGIF